MPGNEWEIFTKTQTTLSDFSLQNYRHSITHQFLHSSVKKTETESQNQKNALLAVVQRTFPKIALTGYQTIAFILSFFRNVVSESNQIDSLKNAHDDHLFDQILTIDSSMQENRRCAFESKLYIVEKDGSTFPDNERSISQSVAKRKYT